MSLELLEAVKELEASQKVSIAAAQRSLVVAVKTGALKDAKAIVERLADVGMTSGDLTDRLARYDQRFELAETVRAGASADADLVAHRRKIDAFDAEWKVVFEKHENDSRGLQFESERLASLYSQAQEAKRALRDSAGGEVRNKLDGLTASIRKEQAKLDELARDADRHQASYHQNKLLADDDKLEASGVASLPGSWERLTAKREAIEAQKSVLAALNQQFSDVLETQALAPENF